MLGDCDLSKSLSKILVSTLIQTLDEIGKMDEILFFIKFVSLFALL